MKIYIAAPFELRTLSIHLMEHLESKGHEVTSTWLKKLDENSHETAQTDLADIARSEVLILVNFSEWASRGTGGRHVEFGYALALGIPVIVHGSRTNLFHYLAHVKVLSPDQDPARFL